MDPENPSSIVLPIAIMIAILAACGILSLVMIVLIGVITLAVSPVAVPHGRAFHWSTAP